MITAEMIYSGKRTCKRTDCLYYSPKVDYNGCDYCFLTGIPRSCPKGADCIRYKYATEQQRSHYRTGESRMELLIEALIAEGVLLLAVIATAIAINFFHREENTDGKQDKQED